MPECRISGQCRYGAMLCYSPAPTMRTDSLWSAMVKQMEGRWEPSPFQASDIRHISALCNGVKLIHV
jgi:hypothetical protein